MGGFRRTWPGISPPGVFQEIQDVVPQPDPLADGLPESRGDWPPHLALNEQAEGGLVDGRTVIPPVLINEVIPAVHVTQVLGLPGRCPDPVIKCAFDGRRELHGTCPGQGWQAIALPTP